MGLDGCRARQPSSFRLPRGRDLNQWIKQYIFISLTTHLYSWKTKPWVLIIKHLDCVAIVKTDMGNNYGANIGLRQHWNPRLAFNIRHCGTQDYLVGSLTVLASFKHCSVVYRSCDFIMSPTHTSFCIDCSRQLFLEGVLAEQHHGRKKHWWKHDLIGNGCYLCNQGWLHCPSNRFINYSLGTYSSYQVNSGDGRVA